MLASVRFYLELGQPSLLEFLPQHSHPILSMQDLTLDLSKQLCILSLCRGVPRVRGQDAGRISLAWAINLCEYLVSIVCWA